MIDRLSEDEGHPWHPNNRGLGPDPQPQPDASLPCTEGQCVTDAVVIETLAEDIVNKINSYIISQQEVNPLGFQVYSRASELPSQFVCETEIDNDEEAYDKIARGFFYVSLKRGKDINEFYKLRVEFDWTKGLNIEYNKFELLMEIKRLTQLIAQRKTPPNTVSTQAVVTTIIIIIILYYLLRLFGPAI